MVQSRQQLARGKAKAHRRSDEESEFSRGSVHKYPLRLRIDFIARAWLAQSGKREPDPPITRLAFGKGDPDLGVNLPASSN